MKVGSLKAACGTALQPTQVNRRGSQEGTQLAYYADDDTEVVDVTYPHWMDAQTKSEHAHLLDSYHPV